MVRGPNGLGRITGWRDGIVGDVGFRTPMKDFRVVRFATARRLLRI
jgi:hypothetical protein